MTRHKRNWEIGRGKDESSDGGDGGEGGRQRKSSTACRHCQQAGKEEGAREADMRRKKGSPIAMEFWDAARTGREREREREHGDQTGGDFSP